MKKVVFCSVLTKTVIKDSDDYLFVMNNKVYSDSGYYCESQEQTVQFEDFIKERPDLDWYVTGN